MVDRVKLLKYERTNGGSQDNRRWQTEIDPSEDYAVMKGVCFEENVNRILDLDSNGDLQFTDNSHTNKTFKSITDVFLETKEPTGFITRNTSTISFNESNRTLTLEPTNSEFEVYVKGNKLVINNALSVQIPDVSGNYFFYIDAQGSLQYQEFFDPSLLEDKVYTAFVYWNADDGIAVSFGEERHGVTMDGATHAYLHTTVGTRLVRGAAIEFNDQGDGSENSHAQINLSDMVVADEDIVIQINNSATPNAPFEQVLFPIAEIPIFYRNGTNWTKLSATSYPLVQGSNRIQYNKEENGVWGLEEIATDGRVSVSYIFATTSLINPVVALVGQKDYADEEEAETQANWDELDFGDLPFQEIKLLYLLIFETNSTFSNTPKARLVRVRDYRFGIDRSVSAASQNTDHSNLSGLGNDDHLQYLPRSGARPMTGDLSLGNQNITNINQANGVVIQAHKDRHLPNGDDPLDTASAVTLNAATTNTEGNANSFARSNHTHAITTASAITLTANTTNTEGTAESIARANHTHEITKGTPIQLLPDQTNTEGNSVGLARADHIHNVPTASGVTISTDGTNTQGNANTFARSNHTHKVEIARNNVRATGEVQTTSTNDVLLQNMTITPPAGTYLVFAFAQPRHNNSNGKTWYSIYAGGTQVSNTLYDVDRGGNQGDVHGAYNMSCEVTVNGSQAIDIRWRSQSGTARTFGRYLTLIRVA